MALLSVSTTYNRMFKMISSSDHLSLKTGAAPVVKISKNAGAFATAAGTVTEIANGWYEIALTTADTGTVGDLAYYITGTGADDTDFCDQVGGANVTQWNGTNVSSPATAGIPDINVKNINNVSAASVTTVNANQGTTQPLNFTGTAGSALVKSDMTDIAGVAVSTTTAQLGVNVVQMNAVAASSITTINANQGTTQPINFTGTAGSAFVQVDVRDIAGAAVATGTAQIGVNVVNWGGTATSGAIPPDVTFIRSGTAQAGAAATITLDAGASATNNLYQNCTIFIRSGTGAGQSNVIASYVGSTKVATVANTWATNPDATSVFTIAAFGPVNGASLGALTGAQIATAVWQDAVGSDFTVASSIGNSLYTGNHAPGAASGLALVGSNMGTITGALTAAQIATGVWQDAVGSDFTTASSIGKSLYTSGNIPGAASGLALVGSNMGTVNVTQWSGTNVAAPATAGIPEVNVKNIANHAATVDANNLLKVDVEDINGNATAAQALAQSTQSICWGTAGTGSTTTNLVVATLNNPSALTDTSQLVGRTIIFLGGTSSTHLQAQASNITSSGTGATPNIGFTALTFAPAVGDVFVVL
jgi:hypothetical protein